MTVPDHALVWIDHRIAKIFTFNASASTNAVVHSQHPDVHIHHKANSGDSGHAVVDKEFLHRVVLAIPAAAAILIAGPGTAKTELRAYIQHLHPIVAARISAVETVDHPSDGELLKFGRDFFRLGDRVHA